jgi:hypothetical protein
MILTTNMGLGDHLKPSRQPVKINALYGPATSWTRDSKE